MLVFNKPERKVLLVVVSSQLGNVRRAFRVAVTVGSVQGPIRQVLDVSSKSCLKAQQKCPIFSQLGLFQHCHDPFMLAKRGAWNCGIANRGRRPSPFLPEHYQAETRSGHFQRPVKRAGLSPVFTRYQGAGR